MQDHDSDDSRETEEDVTASGGETDVDDFPLPPGPDGYPLLGSSHQVVRRPLDFYDTLAEHGDVVRYSAFGQPFTTVLHPDYVEQVLLSEHGSFEKWLGEEFTDDHFAPEGLVFTSGEQWQRQRTIVQEMFTIDRIQTFADVMGEYADDLVDSWADGETVALNRAFPELTLRILVHTLLDVDLDGVNQDVIREGVDVVNEQANPRNLSALVPEWVPTPFNRRYRRALSDLRGFVDDLVARRRRALEQGGEVPDDLLSVLVTAEDDEGRTLSETEIRDQMLTFLGAGTETTALALTYTFLELAKHDDVSQRLATEHERVLDGESPGLEQFDQLDYTEAVIDEAMRLYPPAYMMFREASEDVAIGGYRIPEGEKVTVPQFHVQTDPRWYDDPETFRPSRWLAGLEDDLPDYAYFPFGGGPRHCIGMRFAMMELKHIVTTIAQAVDLELLSDPDPGFAPGLTLQPADDVRVRVSK